MIDPKVFRQWVECGMVMAKDFLIQKGQMPNILCAYRPEGVDKDPTVFPLFSVPRDIWPFIAQGMAKDTEALCNISEVWAAKVTAEQWKDDKRPAGERDNREERLMVQAKMIGGVTISLYQRFEHDWEGKIKWIGGVEELPTDKEKYESYILDDVYRR